MGREHIELAHLAGLRFPILDRQLARPDRRIAHRLGAFSADQPGADLRILEQSAAALWRAVAAHVLREILGRRMSARTYVASLRGPVENAIHARDDRGPGLYEYPMLVGTLVRRLASGREV